MTHHPFAQRFSPPRAAASRSCRVLLWTTTCVLLAFVVTRTSPALADIFNDQTEQLIPGTQGITPGPGVDLSGWNTPGHQLEFAHLELFDLTNASFATSDLINANFVESTLTNANLTNANLTNAKFSGSTLTNANLTDATLTNATLYGSTLTDTNFTNTKLTNAFLETSILTNANFSGAIVNGANFLDATGFTASQLYSTASYASGDLTGIVLGDNDVTDGNFANKNLTNANFLFSTLTNANFTNANLTNAFLESSTLTNASLTNANLTNANLNGSTLTNANFSGAIVKGANFVNTTGFTASQLESTASYASRDLTGILLNNNDLTAWNFANQNLTGAGLELILINADFTNANLTNANLNGSTLTNANFSGAIVKGANFFETTGFTASQLESTASYASRDLTGILLNSIDLTSGKFANQNLTNAGLSGSTLTNANFTNANLTNAFLELSTLTNASLTNANLTNANLQQSTLTNSNFTGAIVTGADFSNTTGFTASQLESTASYASRDLAGILLYGIDLTSGNFANQNLTGAGLESILINADFTNANLTNADLGFSDLTNTNFTNANLANAYLDSSILTTANFSGADLRGASGWSPDATTITHNTIRPDGSIQGLALLAGEKLVVHNNPIAITVNTNATFDPASTLQFLLDNNWTSPIGFSPGLTPALGGTLDVEFATGVDPASLLGQTFQLFNWNGPLSADNRFATLELPGGGLTWNTSQLYTTGAVTVGGVLGDYNGDGVVDAADYVVWRATLGSTTNLAADGNDNGVVDDGDFDIWRAHYGEHASGGASTATSAAVPEPSSLLLAGLGVAMLGLFCKRKIAINRHPLVQRFGQSAAAVIQRCILIGIAIAAVCAGATANAQYALTTLAMFNGANGQNPVGNLIADANGNLYGTTSIGGAEGDGTVFEMANDANHTLTTLATFNGTNGSDPNAGLIADASGNLYGTTFRGGASGMGTVFEVANDANHTLTTLAKFNGANGANPFAGLLADTSGNLYGTTQHGGASDAGTVFEVANDANHTLTTLAMFDGTNGGGPDAGLLADASGNLFGTTQRGGALDGGAYGNGTVFELSLVPEPSSLALGLLALGALPLLARPRKRVLREDYQAIRFEYGPVFGFVPNGKSRRKVFMRGKDMNIIQRCILLAVAAAAVCAGSTTAAQYKLTTLATFNGTNGGTPYAGLIADASGNLYGTTAFGGDLTLNNGSGDGTVFKVANDANHTLTTLVTFNGTNGYDPEAGLLADAGGNLYGTTFGVGANGDGTVFKVANDANHTLTTLVAFNGANGADPAAGLIADATGNLYGTTWRGGAGDGGTVFNVANDANYTLTTLATFKGTNGFEPGSRLLADASGNLYGTTFRGGANNDGFVFKVANDANHTLTILSGTDNATGGLIADANGNLYGTGYGLGDDGYVFEVANDANHTFSILAKFNGANGAHPFGGLIADANGNLYGTTQHGGASDAGTVFEVANDANHTLTTLAMFDGTNGYGPGGGLLADAGGNLYGTTQGGGR